MPTPGLSPLPDDPATRTILLHAVWSGLCPLIPVPFLDDWVLRQIRLRMVDELAAHRRIELDDPARWMLASGPEPERRGCLGGCVGLATRLGLSLLVRLVRKIFRKVVFVLALKDAADAASRSFHRGWLLAAAFARGDLDHATPHRVSSSIVAAMEIVEPRLFERAIGRVISNERPRLFRAARRLGRDLRREGEPLRRDEEEIEPLVAALEQELRKGEGDLDRLRKVYRRLLDEATPPVTGNGRTA